MGGRAGRGATGLRAADPRQRRSPARCGLVPAGRESSGCKGRSTPRRRPIAAPAGPAPIRTRASRYCGSRGAAPRAAGAAIGRALDETVEPLARARLLPARVEILLAGHDLEGARAAGEELAEIAARFQTDVLGATAVQARGALELASGNPREAVVRLRLAWKEWQALEIPHAAARAREVLGLACRALGDRAGGRMELEAARAAYESLGAGPDVARVDALLAHRVDAGPHGLTAREVQVLRLVAAGKSNKEVADTLALSVKTVERHVGNILTKLDVPSRVAATAWAYENEMIRRTG